MPNETLYIVKTTGRAAGKGVLVTADIEEAMADVRAKLTGGPFGAAGPSMIVEVVGEATAREAE